MRFIRPIVLLAFLALMDIGSMLPVLVAQTPYRILVTNDDGVRAPGILALAEALKSVGEVTIVAPAENQSGKGHSLSITDPVYVDTITLAGGIEALSATATPASCVKIAVLALLEQRPDLIVSGINRGVNTGRIAYVSGTVGAAREGALHGIPAIAASLDTSRGFSDYAPAAKATAEIAAMVKANGLPPGVFLNVNVPEGTPKGLRLATQSKLTGDEKWIESKNPRGRRYFWNDFSEPAYDPADPNSDVSALAAGFVAIVPMDTTEYNAAAADKLRGLIK
jgi:5'-nucleotidase